MNSSCRTALPDFASLEQNIEPIFMFLKSWNYQKQTKSWVCCYTNDSGNGYRDRFLTNLSYYAMSYSVPPKLRFRTLP